MSNITPPQPLLPNQMVAIHSDQQPNHANPQIKEAVKSSHSSEKTDKDKKHKQSKENMKKQGDSNQGHHLLDLEV